MNGVEEIRAIVLAVAQGLGNYPAEIAVELIPEQDTGLCIVIRCHHVDKKDTDFGLIVGKKGKYINALRTLIEAIGAKHRIATSIVVKE